MWIVEIEDRADGHMPIGTSVDDYLEMLRAQIVVLETARDIGLTLHHRGEGAFWFTTDDAKLAARHGGREGTFELETEASLQSFLEDAERG